MSPPFTIETKSDCAMPPDAVQTVPPFTGNESRDRGGAKDNCPAIIAVESMPGHKLDRVRQEHRSTK